MSARYGEIRESELRVALFSDAVPDRNGVGTYYRDLSEHLRDRVGRVELFCPQVTEQGWSDAIRFPLPGDATQRVCIPNPLELARRYEDLAPHAVVLATPAPYGLLGLRLARKHGAHIAVGFHTHFEKLTDLYWKDHRVVGRCFRLYLESCNKLLFRYATTVLANSEEMLDIARRLGARDPELMGTAIPRPFVATPVTALGDTLRVVTFAGRLAAEKNLRAVVAAAEAVPAIEFRLAGDGPERALIENAAARLNNLQYLGWLPRDRMLAVIDATDLLVLPSHVESFGTIALEAMARNRSVLVSSACGITQWPALSRGLFRIGASESLASAIERIASLDPALRTHKARLARDAAIELNQWTVDHWIGVLTRPAGTHSAHG